MKVTSQSSGDLHTMSSVMVVLGWRRFDGLEVDGKGLGVRE
jgi:hypothetical protein